MTNEFTEGMVIGLYEDDDDKYAIIKIVELDNEKYLLLHQVEDEREIKELDENKMYVIKIEENNKDFEFVKDQVLLEKIIDIAFEE